MENESLEIFLRRKNEESKSKRKAIDWEGRKQQWLAWLDKLYEEVNDWLSPFKNELSKLIMKTKSYQRIILVHIQSRT